MKTLLLILLLSITAYAQTYCYISGKTKDENGYPIAYARIDAVSRGCYSISVYSNNFGNYRIPVNTECGFVNISVHSKYKYNWQPASYSIWFPQPTTVGFGNLWFTGYYQQW